MGPVLPALSRSVIWLIPYPASPSTSSRLGLRAVERIWTIVRCRWTTVAASGSRTKAADHPQRQETGIWCMTSPARACALAVLRRVFEQGAWADRALHGEARRLGLDPRERALAMRLAYGAVQRRATLDHLIETLAGRPVERLEPLVLAALRLGLYQLAYVDRVPAHAAVDASVELVKAGAPRA